MAMYERENPVVFGFPPTRDCLTSMQVLTCSLEINAPAHEIWRVLTTPELVKEWACAYLVGLSIRTSWKEGGEVSWRAADGEVQARGKVAAFRPDRLLKFDYDAGPSGERPGFSETFAIEPVNGMTRLQLTTGPLGKADYDAMRGRAAQAVEEIKSLAEESAQIHGLR